MIPEKIPRSTHPFFQEYNPDDLSPESDSGLIIERILAYGNRQEIRWLFRCFGQDRITEWIELLGNRRLPWRRYNLFCVLLDLTPSHSRDVEQRIWPY